MFTGLIESVGRVRAFDPSPGGRRLVIETPLAAEFTLGESVACSGVCLTVVEHDQGAAAFDVAPSTLAVTAIGSWQRGTAVNLERALRFGDRLGGHVVQGHVDGTGRLERVTAQQGFHRITVGFAAEHARLLIVRGSVALDGISLTVAALHDTSFEVQIVPHTWQVTSLSDTPVGASVNLEFDMVAKYILRAADLEGMAKTPPDSL
jgi:riboflavin synthase